MTILKNAREIASLTQVEVAKKVGISERGYQRYEAGKRVPDVYTAQKIAKVLESTVEVLFPIPSAATGGIQTKPDGNRA